MALFKRALLVDDDPAANFINERFLQLNNLAEDLAIFENPLVALSWLEENNWQKSQSLHLPDLLLLDINMPLLNGFEVLDTLLQWEWLPNRNVFVFLLSSSYHPGDLAKAQSYPLAGYLQKPLDEAKIRQIIQAVEVTSQLFREI
jgi:CheY-like chemotaxis protein